MLSPICLKNGFVSVSTDKAMVPLAGGAVTTLVDDVQSGIDLSVAGDALVWTESVCCAHGQQGRVRRLEPGGEPEIVAEGLDDPGAGAANGGEVYGVEGGPIGLIEGFGRIATVPLAGGKISDVIAGVSTALPIVVTDGATRQRKSERVTLRAGEPRTLDAITVGRGLGEEPTPPGK